MAWRTTSDTETGPGRQRQLSQGHMGWAIGHGWGQGQAIQGQGYFALYSIPLLIRPPYLPRNYGHIREVALQEGEVNAFIVVVAKISGHIREGSLPWKWPLREGLLYSIYR